ncbi:MAG: hypothetical protein ACRDVM_09315, partial [Acidimicrobiia bacterium]
FLPGTVPREPRPGGERRTEVSGRLLAAAILVVGVGAACGSGELGRGTTTPPSTTLPTTTVATTVAPSSSTVPPTTGTLVSEQPGVVVANQAGVWHVTSGGESQLVAAPAAVAFDDLAGGVVFQQAAPYDDTGPSTTIWHVAAGEAVAIVEEPLDGRLNLLDLADIDGEVSVVFTSETGVGPEDQSQILETVALATGERRAVGEVGGWKSGVSSASWSGDWFALNHFFNGSSRFYALDQAGNEVDLSFNPNPGCFDDVTCPRSVAVTGDGLWFVYLQLVSGESGFYDDQRLVAVDAATGEVQAGVLLSVAGFDNRWLHIHWPRVVVSRFGPDEQAMPTEPLFPLLVDLSEPDAPGVPVEWVGVATVARTTPTVAGPVEPP